MLDDGVRRLWAGFCPYTGWQFRLFQHISYSSLDLVLKGVLDDPSEVLSPIFANDIPNSGRQVQHSPLRHRPFYQHVYITLQPRT